jgi:cell cycle sensor histidine kinase DivJ
MPVLGQLNRGRSLVNNHPSAALLANQLILAWERYVSGLINPAIAADAVQLARHRGFIIANLLGGLVALSALPVVLILSPPGRLFIVLGLATLAAQAPLALFLSRSGRLETAHGVQSIIFATVVFGVAVNTGGLFSPAMFWLLVIPAEAALAGSKRMLAISLALCLAVVSGLGIFSHLSPTPTLTLPAAAYVVVVLATIAYMTLLGVRIEQVSTAGARRACEIETRLNVLARSAVDILAIFRPGGEAELLTPSAERMLDTDPGKLTGTGLFHRILVSDRPAFLKALSDAGSGIDPGPVELRIRRGSLDALSSEHLWIEMACRPVNEAGNEAGNEEGADGLDWDNRIVAVLRDISPSKGASQELQTARDQAQAAQRDKVRFLANVSHELRTPLNAIIGFSDLLTRDVLGPIDNDRHREYAQLIRSSGEHLLQVVNGVLDISKIEAGNFDIAPEQCDIGEMIDRARSMVAHQANKAGVTIVCEIDAGLPDLYADPRACRQILLNLLSNAIKFSADSGRITLSVTGGEAAIRLTVEDHGIGINAADITRLGEPYFQVASSLSQNPGGTGLGLSVVRGLVDMHAGTLEFFSRPGHGTRAVVSLPAETSAPDRVDNVKQLRAG